MSSLELDQADATQGFGMGFVNEYISDADVEKYNLKAIDEKFISGGTHARDWTIDRERNIYLRNVAMGRGLEPGGNKVNLSYQTTWTLYWRGDLLTMRLDLLDGKGGCGEPGWSHWRLVWLEGEHAEIGRREVLEVLKEALLAYKDFGVFSVTSGYSVTLDIDDSCVL